MHPRGEEIRDLETSTPDNAAVRRSDAATPAMGRRRGAVTVDVPPGCIFRPNAGMGGCFFLCVEQATGHSVSSQRMLIATQLNQESLAM